MSSYFDYFCTHIEKNSDTIRGTCNSMCPDEEVILREREDLVHVLEVLGPIRKYVKSYSRSAADTNIAKPNLLRPYSVLIDTLHYLLLEVTKRREVSSVMVYDFVNDRLRAIRQDMTIQRLPPEQCVKLLEPMIRFYVYYGYKFSNLPTKGFDSDLNKKYLLECIKWFLSCIDTMDLSTNRNIDLLSDFISNLNIKNVRRYTLGYDRVLMECLYILCNLDDVHPLYRYLNFSKDLKSDPRLNLAFKIAIANMKGNYIKIFKSMNTLCPLSYCALCTYLPVLQRKALLTLAHAYNSKKFVVPIEVITRWLRLSSNSDTIKVCSHYGIKTEGNNILFNKGEFKTDAFLHQTSLEDDTMKHLDLSIDNIFTYSS